MDPLDDEITRSIIRPLGSDDLLQIAVIVLVAIAAVSIVERGLPPVAARLGVRAHSLLVRWVPVFRLLVVFLTAMMVVPLVIVPSTENLLGVVGAGAVAIGFAFKDYLTSILAGIVVLFERPYRQGDWIRIGDVYGEVRDLGMRAVQIATPEDDVVTVPHGHIWTDPVHNSNDGAATLQCEASFYVDPDHDASEVCRALEDAVLSSPWLDPRKPIAVVIAEKPWGTHYLVRSYPLAARDQFRFKSDVTVRGKGLLRALGVRAAAVPSTEALGSA